jgi:hypothetical protein
MGCPRGFGGPDGPGSTDVGTGVINSLVFPSLLVINAAHGPSRYSLDSVIETRWLPWKRIAEISGSQQEKV